jgi:hypothetical protein
MRGWRKTVSRKAGFPRRCARTVTEPIKIRAVYAALQKGPSRAWTAYAVTD